VTELAAPFVAVMATGRSDYPNQIKNVLCFPGIFRGALACRASSINEEMKLAAAQAIAGTIRDDELDAEYIVPSVFDRRVAETVAHGVEEAAYRTGVARRARASDQDNRSRCSGATPPVPLESSAGVCCAARDVVCPETPLHILEQQPT
jgi:malate dehydrogenase (oxaloacetate-decarboxylating)